ncbi:MAG: type II secretion system protein [Nitrospirae bacterium]|nr:type II secretion system protein [Nitrospirota bacterium]
MTRVDRRMSHTQSGLLRHPRGSDHCHSAPSAQSGFSYLFALFTIVLVGLSMMGANLQWKTMLQREREAELLFRGDQYRRAIAAYVYGQAGPLQYPLRVDDLLKDPRTSKRYLRTAYLDPITGRPFTTIPCVDRIKGVHSPSEAPTLKRDNFPPEYAQFNTVTTYREWIFQYDPSQEPVKPGLPPPPLKRC